MSKENLARFMSKVADSEELQAKIGEEIDAEALIALGAECGCEFSAEELTEAAELSDDELDSIAGGFIISRELESRVAGSSELQLTHGQASGGPAYRISLPPDGGT